MYEDVNIIVSPPNSHYNIRACCIYNNFVFLHYCDYDKRRPWIRCLLNAKEGKKKRDGTGDPTRKEQSPQLNWVGDLGHISDSFVSHVNILDKTIKL